MKPQIIMMVIYAILNIWGLVEWTKGRSILSLWEVQQSIMCVDCGQVSRGYRLVRTKNYDRTKDVLPEFRCEKCSEKKTRELKARGIMI